MKALEAQSETKVAIKSVRLGGPPILMTIPTALIQLFLNKRLKPQQIRKCRPRQPGSYIPSTYY